MFDPLFFGNQWQSNIEDHLMIEKHHLIEKIDKHWAWYFECFSSLDIIVNNFFETIVLTIVIKIFPQIVSFIVPLNCFKLIFPKVSPKTVPYSFPQRIPKSELLD